jgi:hypothetical protein
VERPLLAEDPHPVDVDEAAAVEEAVAERRLRDEPESLVDVAGPLVEVVHVEPHPDEPQLPEAEVEERRERVGAVAPGRVSRVADRDPDPGAAVHLIDLVEVEAADRAAIVEPADDEVPAVAALVLLEVLEPALLLRPAHRAAEREEPGCPGVGEPADEQRDVVTLGRTEEDEPAAEHRFRAAGALVGW